MESNKQKNIRMMKNGRTRHKKGPMESLVCMVSGDGSDKWFKKESNLQVRVEKESGI